MYSYDQPRINQDNISVPQNPIKNCTLILVMYLSTNGERAYNYTIVKQLILTSNTRATKKKRLSF